MDTTPARDDEAAQAEFWEVANTARIRYGDAPADARGMTAMSVPFEATLWQRIFVEAPRWHRVVPAYTGGATFVLGALYFPGSPLFLVLLTSLLVAAVTFGYLRLVDASTARTITVPAPLAAAWADYEDAAETLRSLDAPLSSRVAVDAARERLLDLLASVRTRTDNFADWSLGNQWTNHPARAAVMVDIGEFIDTCAMAHAVAVIEQRRHDVVEASVAAPPIALDSAGRPVADATGMLAAATDSIAETHAVAQMADLPVRSLGAGPPGYEVYEADGPDDAQETSHA